MKLSVSIICFNNENTIENVIKAVAPLADEIIAVDSFSTDKTPELASKLGAKVYTESWKGHISQKNSALEKCTGEWIFCVDSDEVLTDEALISIKNVINSDSNLNGYEINRRTYYMGKLLKHSWQPDWKLRLVRRSASPKWDGYDPHDKLTVTGKTGKIKGDLIHYSFKDFADHMQRTIQHAKVAAASYHKKGKKSGVFAILFKPLFAFIKKFIIQGSFLDGIPGIIAALSGAVYVYMKYSFLYELQKQKNTDI